MTDPIILQTMRHAFLERTDYLIFRIEPRTVKRSIRGIKKLINRLRKQAWNSKDLSYVVSREEKIEKLQLIIVDLKRLL